MNGQNDFSDTELKLIQVTKDTLRLLAKVIRDRDVNDVISLAEVEAVIEDQADKPLAKIIKESRFLTQMGSYVAPESEIDDEQLKILRDTLRNAIEEADPEIETPDETLDEIIKALEALIIDKIEANRITPDLPSLDPNEEAAVIGQMGQLIFAELLEEAA
jgi:SpoVK/Ycf46/Vps4 family AAA+-type ATPase